jgi:hypothetical protein
MAMREYTDGRGVRWTVWSVSSDALHPATRSEDFLRQFASGWLCFESADGQKRRLIEYPQGWDSLSDEQLGLLCDRAVPRTGNRCSGAPGTTPASRPQGGMNATPDSEEDAALSSAEIQERRRTDLAPPPDHPMRRQSDR